MRDLDLCVLTKKRSPAIRLAALGATGCVLLACGSDAATPFPPGLEPLDPTNEAVAPAAKPGDPYPEDIAIVSGDTGDYAWVHARAYVHAPLAETWAALRDPEVCVDRRTVDEWSSTAGVDPAYAYSFVTHNTISGLVTIHFDVTWREGVVTGTASEPTAIAVRMQKTDGTTFIPILAASGTGRRVDDGTTSIELIQHVRATGQGVAELETAARDFYGSVVARVHGRPLPTVR
jgi:hypothetical protein